MSRVVAALCAIVACSNICLAHLGEEHPPGQHDYFPDFAKSDVSDQIYLRNVLNVVGSRDIEEIPDGSGRFLSVRGINHVKLTSPGRVNERFYVGIGETAIGNTEGATSLAIHPEFATEGAPGYGKFYTAAIDLTRTGTPDFESRNSAETSHYVLTEWTQADITKDSFQGTSRELMRFDEGSRFHNLNHLIFGPGGLLYVAVGEDTIGSQADDLDSVYGKVLRIDPLGTDSANGQYGIPADNPFVGDPDAAPEVYAYGLRNPWRLAIDRTNGDIYSFDVGWDSIEEVSFIEAGKNYGWPHKEGSFLTAREAAPDLPDPDTGLTVAQRLNLVDPIFELDHTDTNSIIGGVVYRGERFPDLQGKVIFGSWNTHELYVGDPETKETKVLVEGEVLKDFMNNINYVSINEDADGEIYIAGGIKIVSLFAEPDFDDSGTFDTSDIDLICGAFGSDGSRYDLNGDLKVDGRDIDEFLGFANSIAGDLNLNGTVDFFDFLGLAEAFGQAGSWSSGDFDCNGTVEFLDFLTLAENFGRTREDLLSVPESHLTWFWGALLPLLRRGLRRRRCHS